MTTATQNAGSITVYTGGLSPTVTVTLHGSNATLFSDQACTVSQANPFTATTDTTVYVTNSGQYVVSATVNGVELVGAGAIPVSNGPSAGASVRCAANPIALAQALSAGGGSSPLAWAGPFTVTADMTDGDPIGYTPPVGAQVFTYSVVIRTAFDGFASVATGADPGSPDQTFALNGYPQLSPGGSDWIPVDLAGPPLIVVNAVPLFYVGAGSTTGDADVYFLVANDPSLT